MSVCTPTKCVTRPSASLIDEFEEDRCKRFVCREPRAEVPYESREALCKRFVCREPLAEVLRPFVGDRCLRFACQKPLAEILHGLEEARCESFSRREPLAEALGPFEAYRGSFEEPLRERPAGRNPRAGTLPSPREDASLPRESLSTFSSRLHSNSQTARARRRRRARRFATGQERWRKGDGRARGPYQGGAAIESRSAPDKGWTSAWRALSNRPRPRERRSTRRGRRTGTSARPQSARTSGRPERTPPLPGSRMHAPSLQGADEVDVGGSPRTGDRSPANFVLPESGELLCQRYVHSKVVLLEGFGIGRMLVDDDHFGHVASPTRLNTGRLNTVHWRPRTFAPALP